MYIYTLYICIYMYNKTSIKRNILTIKQNTSVSRLRTYQHPGYRADKGAAFVDMAVALTHSLQATYIKAAQVSGTGF